MSPHMCCSAALYDLTVITGHFETVRYTVASVSKDKRILALILAYCFSSFVEGATGFSTPVALAGALLVGVGVPPLQAAAAALMGNTVAVTFGGVGIAVTTLGSVTRLDPEILGVAITRLIIPITIIMPFMVVSCVTDSWWEVLAVWPACLLAGVTHICGMLVIAQYLGVQTVSILGECHAPGLPAGQRSSDCADDGNPAASVGCRITCICAALHG